MSRFEDSLSAGAVITRRTALKVSGGLAIGAGFLSLSRRARRDSRR